MSDRRTNPGQVKGDDPCAPPRDVAAHNGRPFTVEWHHGLAVMPDSERQLYNTNCSVIPQAALDRCPEWLEGINGDGGGPTITVMLPELGRLGGSSIKLGEPI